MTDIERAAIALFKWGTSHPARLHWRRHSDITAAFARQYGVSYNDALNGRNMPPGEHIKLIERIEHDNG